MARQLRRETGTLLNRWREGYTLRGLARERFRTPITDKLHFKLEPHAGTLLHGLLYLSG